MARAGKAAKAKVRSAKAKLDKVEGPSPNPMTNLILTDLLLRGGGRILRHAVESALLKSKYEPGKAKKIIRGRGMGQTLVSTAIARVATQSVPGAILVGGGMLAKMLYDRKQGRRSAQAEGEKAVAEQAEQAPKV